MTNPTFQDRCRVRAKRLGAEIVERRAQDGLLLEISAVKPDREVVAEIDRWCGEEDEDLWRWLWCQLVKRCVEQVENKT